MRSRSFTATALCTLLCTAPALADVAAPGTAQAEPSPTVETPPAATQRPTGSLGIGPTYFGMIGNGVERYGVALDLDARVPLDGRLGLDFHFAWGLTEFHRFDDFTNAGYRLGQWTTKAYVDVWNWAAVNDQWEVFRWMGAFFAFVGLAFPYIGAGVAYVLAPVAPTTYLEIDLAPVYELGDKNVNPYLKAGLGFVGYWHPVSGRPSLGLGPTAGFGARVRGFDFSAEVTWLPHGLHGEDPGESTNVVVGGITIGLTR
jgi:hypothetical protein